MNNARSKKPKVPTPPDANAELELLRERLKRLKGASPSLDALMQEWKEKSTELDDLETRIAALYPDACPKCGYCGTPFQRGQRTSCCGSL